MIAYNKQWLSNLFVQQQAAKANEEGCIGKTEIDTIKNNYPVGFYTPNPFVRIGLFVLTIVITAFTLGLFCLLFINSNSNTFSALAIFFGLLTYIALEVMVQKSHYQSGVDDALMWMSAALIIGGLNTITNISALNNACIIFFMALYYTLRFTNMLMSIVTCIALLAIVFFAYIKLGNMAKITMPFLLMLITAMIYFFAKAQVKKQQWQLYKNCITTGLITLLLAFYVAGNYYVVKETSDYLFNQNTEKSKDISLAWFFWLFTIVIPVLYIFRGIQKKDAVLLRTGLLLVAAIIFTIRYYHQIMPIEIAFVIGGGILIGIAYTIIKYLEPPKHGFTYKEQSDKLFIDKLQIESLVIAETFTAPTVTTSDTGTHFGGGSGGGGGATGDF